MSDAVESLASLLIERFGARLARLPATPGELTFEVAPADLVAVCRELRDDAAFGFETLADLSGIDYLDFGLEEWQTERATGTGFSRGVRSEAHGSEAAARRFAVVYHLLSIAHNRRLRLRAYCEPGEPPMMPSITEVWPGADWFEREAFDLFGVLFRGHPDLRRLLTDYGFIGHPFRKDFPLSGHVEVRYDPEKRRVVYQPVSIEPRTLVPRVIRADHRYDPALTGAPVAAPAAGKPNA
jgi:NADH-quinone oxidoreductase subunit C